MYSKLTFILFLLLFACDNNDDNSGKELTITEEALNGDWLRISYFIGQSGDTDGTSGISQDLKKDLVDCKKDDILRYQVSSSSNSNELIFGISSLSCEGEESNDFISTGTWNLSDKSIVHFINDFSTNFEIVSLTADRLKVKFDGTNNDNGIVYTFSEYKRLK